MPSVSSKFLLAGAAISASVLAFYYLTKKESVS